MTTSSGRNCIYFW